MHLCVELSDVGSDFLLGFCLRLTGEGFSLLLSLLVKVPDYALPAAIGSPKYIAICCESFLWHGATPFLNHQQYSSGGGNVQTNVVNGAEKNLPTFWWIYTCLGRGNFFRPILCLATQFLRWPWLSRGGEKRGGTGGALPRTKCTADSRALCLPCLKAGIFCFYTTAAGPYMSSFLFLTFCVYVFCCLGLHFTAVPVSYPFFRWLCTGPAQTSTGASRRANRAGLQLRWCRSPTRPPKLHKGPHRGEFGSHFLFLVRFFCGSPSNWRSRW